MASIEMDNIPQDITVEAEPEDSTETTNLTDQV